VRDARRLAGILRAVRRLLAWPLLALLAACGGSAPTTTAPAASVPPPPTGTVTFTGTRLDVVHVVLDGPAPARWVVTIGGRAVGTLEQGAATLDGAAAAGDIAIGPPAGQPVLVATGVAQVAADARRAADGVAQLAAAAAGCHPQAVAAHAADVAGVLVRIRSPSAQALLDALAKLRADPCDGAPLAAIQEAVETLAAFRLGRP
jgi:hypothetical protein